MRLWPENTQGSSRNVTELRQHEPQFRVSHSVTPTSGIREVEKAKWRVYVVLEASRDWDPQSNPCAAWVASVIFHKGKQGQLGHAYPERGCQELQVKTRNHIKGHFNKQILGTKPAVPLLAGLSLAFKEMLANIFFIICIY